MTSSDSLHDRLMELMNIETSLSIPERNQLASECQMRRSPCFWRHTNRLLDSMCFILRRDHIFPSVTREDLMSMALVIGKRNGNFETRFYYRNTVWSSGVHYNTRGAALSGLRAFVESMVLN